MDIHVPPTAPPVPTSGEPPVGPEQRAQSPAWALASWARSKLDSALITQRFRPLALAPSSLLPPIPLHLLGLLAPTCHLLVLCYPCT